MDYNALVHYNMYVYSLLLYSLKFSRDKYFMVLPNFAQKQIFAKKLLWSSFQSHLASAVNLTLRDIFFIAALRPMKSKFTKIFNLKNWLYGIQRERSFCSAPPEKQTINPCLCYSGPIEA